MIRTWLLAASLIVSLPVLADARTRCQYFSDGREPLCWTTEDGAFEPYTDGRDRRDSGWFRRMEQMRREQQFRRDSEAEGRADWRNNGTPSSVGTISPFVPGSVQDRAWRDERARRGM